MSAKRFSLPDFTLKKKLILIIMFLVLLQNIVLLEKFCRTYSK